MFQEQVGDLLQQLQPLDVALLSIGLFSSYQGFKRGLIIEFFSNVSMFIALYVCIRFQSEVTTLSTAWLPKISDNTRPWIVFGLLFLGTLVVINTVARMLSYAISLSILGWLDCLLGAVWGAAKVAIGISLFLSFAQSYPSLKNELAKVSLLFTQSKLLVPGCKSILSFIANTLQASLSSSPWTGFGGS